MTDGHGIPLTTKNTEETQERLTETFLKHQKKILRQKVLKEVSALLSDLPEV